MPEEGTGSPGTGITGDCEPTHVSVETPTSVLWRAVSTLSCWAISPAPTFASFKYIDYWLLCAWTGGHRASVEVRERLYGGDSLSIHFSVGLREPWLTESSASPFTCDSASAGPVFTTEVMNLPSKVNEGLLCSSLSFPRSQGQSPKTDTLFLDLPPVSENSSSMSLHLI